MRTRLTRPGSFLILVLLSACGEPPPADPLRSESLRSDRAPAAPTVVALPGCTPEEAAACCAACQENSEPDARGKVCCCDCDLDGMIACAFIAPDPNAPEPFPGAFLMQACAEEHEEGHIADGEGSCFEIEDGHPSVWGPGEDPDTCEPDEYKDEADCLARAKAQCDALYGATSPARDQCLRWIEEREKWLRDQAERMGGCAAHCGSP